MKIEMPQYKHKYTDIEYNFKLIKTALEKSDSDLLVLPEHFLTGYLIRDKISDLAISLNDDKIKELQSTAKKNKRALIFGMPEKNPKIRGQIYNSAVYINKAGEVDVYRKIHMVNFGPFEERRYFTPGHDVHVMSLGECKFGIIICYDIFFPELTKLYALQGADMIVCISASPTVTKKFFQQVMVTRAIESTTFLLYSNLLGTERNLIYWGGNTVIGPRGEIKAQGKELEEDNVTFDIDFSELSVARENRPTLRDTRFELFNALSKFGEIDYTINNKSK